MYFNHHGNLSLSFTVVLKWSDCFGYNYYKLPITCPFEQMLECKHSEVQGSPQWRKGDMQRGKKKEGHHQGTSIHSSQKILAQPIFTIRQGERDCCSQECLWQRWFNWAPQYTYGDTHLSSLPLRTFCKPFLLHFYNPYISTPVYTLKWCQKWSNSM